MTVTMSFTMREYNMLRTLVSVTASNYRVKAGSPHSTVDEKGWYAAEVLRLERLHQRMKSDAEGYEWYDTSEQRDFLSLSYKYHDDYYYDLDDDGDDVV